MSVSIRDRQANVLVPPIFMLGLDTSPWVRTRRNHRYLPDRNDGRSVLNLARSNVSGNGENSYLYFDEGIKNHRSTGIQIDLIFLHCRFLSWFIWILHYQKGYSSEIYPSIDRKCLQFGQSRTDGLSTCCCRLRGCLLISLRVSTLDTVAIIAGDDVAIALVAI